MNKKKLGMIEEFQAIVESLRPGGGSSIQRDDYILALEAQLVRQEEVIAELMRCIVVQKRWIKRGEKRLKNQTPKQSIT